MAAIGTARASVVSRMSSSGLGSSWVVVRLDPGKDSVPSKAAVKVLREISHRHGFETSIAVAGTTLILPPPGPIDGYAPTLRVLGRNVLKVLDKRLDSRYWLGIGGIRDREETLSSSSGEASQAVAVAKRIWRAPRAVLYGDMLPYVALAADRSMCTRIARLLAPLERYDRLRRTRLLHTLDRVNDENWSTAATARAMSIHRHTVEYRVKKVEELLSLSSSDPCDRAAIEFAIVARRLLAPPK